MRRAEPTATGHPHSPRVFPTRSTALGGAREGSRVSRAGLAAAGRGTRAPCVAPGRGRPHTCGIQPLTGRSCREVSTAAQARAAQQTEPAAAGTAACSDPLPQARRGVCSPARPLGNRRRRRCHCCIFPVGTRRPREAKRLSRGGLGSRGGGRVGRGPARLQGAGRAGSARGNRSRPHGCGNRWNLEP